MPELEYETESEGTVAGAEPTVMNVPTEGGTARVWLPSDADDEEVAALIAAVATRLNDDESGEQTAADISRSWSMAGRIGARRRYDLPRECRPGGEWKAAGRCSRR